MRSKATRILEEALALPENARVDLAGRLLESIEPQQPVRGWEEAWASEIERRLREIDAGKAKLIPWSQVRRNLLRSRRAKTRRKISR